jgi:acetyl esterase/lipase
MSEDESVLSRTARAPDAIMAYGAQPDQILEVRHGQGGAARPLVIVIHGGFWRPDIDRAHARPMADAIAAAGWTVLLPEYSRVMHNPAPTFADLRQLLSHSPGQVQSHNGRVVLVGHSAGGQLALWASAAKICPTLSGTLALAPVADLMLAHRLGLGNGAVCRFLGVDPASRPDLDPARMTAPGTPTALLHGLEDDTVPVSLSESYLAHHPATRLTALPGAGHYALIDPQAWAWGRVLAELARWVD